MTLLAPLGLLAGLLAIPVIALHVLRPQRERVRVSSTMLWQELEAPVAPNRPWQRLRVSIPLLLQLLLVALLALALAEPVRTEATQLADHTVIIVDTSASMLADDERPDRVEAAKNRVGELLEDVPSGGSASIVVASGDPELVAVDATDLDSVARAVDRIRPTAGVADFDAAFTLAESVVSADRSTGFVLVSDGGVPDDAQRLAPPGTRYEPIGRSDVNRAIAQLSVSVVDGELTALVTVANTGGPSSTQTLRVDVDGVTVASEEVALPAGQTVERSVAIPPGSRVEAFLDGDDQLLNDNQRAALVPLASDVRVHVRSADGESFFVEQVLEAIGAVAAPSPEEADLVVYDGVPIPETPSTPFISIAGPTAPPGVGLDGTVERPIPTFVADDVVVRDVDVTSTAIAEAQLLSAPDAELLIAGAEGEPLLIEGRSGAVRWFHVAFELERSNLPVEVAYPILFARMVSDLTITDDVPASAVLGSRLPGVDEVVTVTSPRGVATRVAPGSPMPVLDDAGFWTVERADGSLRPVAVVFPSSESTLAVPAALAELPLSPAGEANGEGSGGSTTRTLLPWLIIAAIVVLALETLAGRRQQPVPGGQRLAAATARVAVFALLVGALIGFDWTRSNDDVRAVVVVDVSDSLGAAGDAAARQFLEPLEARPDVAIVEVGRTVRVAKPFGATNVGAGETPAADGTDLVRGVRLGASLLDGTTRERLVVVSDGRNTQGSLGEEFDRLASAGVIVDVHEIETTIATDVAVEALEAPAGVSIDESFQIVADVVAAQPGPAAFELRRDGEVVATQQVDLTPGTNDVVFDVTADAAGVDNYEVAMVGGSDPVPQNDAANTAVHVAGPPRALVVTAVDGGADDLVEALRSRALEVDEVDVGNFPTRDELGAYGAVVLVDVAADDLSAINLDALETHVRDSGNGLVVVGGTSSFALGDYADSPLEDLLPVESRAEDPTREATVAQVLLIDTSESMGACHCADDPSIGGMGGEMIDGGVNKTDISRTAAGRAIAALNADDDVGVLAFNGMQDWVIPLQPVASADVDALDTLRPAGETRILPALEQAADALRDSPKELKHIILFSDGFTPELFDESGGMVFEPMGDVGFDTLDDVRAEVEQLADDGITVSVVATGEGAAPLLETISDAGGGRFYPGRDLDEVPEIFVEEARIASRSFINEGSFVPAVTSTAAPVRGLEAAPPLSGFVAATAKDSTDVMLQVGEFADPLLSAWRVGLGRVTAWTSDAGDRWAADWASWGGWADFWSAVVRDTFPLEGAGGTRVTAELRGESLVVQLESDEAIDAGASPSATVTGPGGGDTELALHRIDDTTFEATMPATDTGSYAVTASLPAAGEDAGGARLGSAVANRSYPIEYRPSVLPTDLVELSERTGGRGAISTEQVLDAELLASGRTVTDLRWPLLLIAALLIPLDLLLHRVRLRTLPDDLRRSRALRRASSLPPPTPTASADASAR